MAFTTEIQMMMHGFGDSRKPLKETATLIESIVHQQMTSLLHQAVDTCEMRGARDIGYEDLLFILRRDQVKLQRLIHYMGVRDEYQRTSVSSSANPDFANLAELSGETEPITRKRHCVNFLQSIDQFGQYEPVYMHSLPDPARTEKAYRLDSFTKHMTTARYKEYCEARRASFCPRLRVAKFKEWLLVDHNADIKLSQPVLEVLNFLAFETVSQIVDLALLVRRDAGGDDVTDVLNRYTTPVSLEPSHPNILITPHTQNTVIGGNSTLPNNAITPDEIREVIRRYFSNNSPMSMFSNMRSPIHNRLFVS